MTTRTVTVALGIAGLLMSVGCGVSQSKYDTTANQLKRASRDLSQAGDAHNKTKQALTSAEFRIKGMHSQLQSVQRQSTEMKSRMVVIEAQLRSCKHSPATPAAPSRPVAPPPPPAANAASATGGLDLAAIQTVIEKLKPKIKRCYTKRILKKGKKLAGTLIAKFRINKRGKTRRVKVRKGTLRHRRLQRCVRRVFRKARFGRSKKTTQVSYPLHFAP
jgi:hypothetical protein